MPRTQRLTILQINDTHAYLDAHWELFREATSPRFEQVGGFARLKTYFDRIRQECGADSVLAFDNGDTLHGTFPAVTTRGQAVIEPLNQLKLDAWTVHWDFAYGTERLRELAAQINHPLLACNCHREDNDESLFPPTVVLERCGIKIGVVGIGSYLIDKAFPTEISHGIYLTLAREELPQQIERLRSEEQVQLIVVISHLGFPQDCQLAAETNGIDVLLSGHTHNRIRKPVVVNGALIIQSGCHGSYVGRLDIEFADGAIVNNKHELIPMDNAVEPDAALQSHIETIYAPHNEMLNEVIGRTVTDLHRYSALESTMDNLLLDAIAEAAGTEIAFSNGWRYGAPIPVGEITVNDLWNIIPTNPPVSVVELLGSEIWDMLEENLERTYARNPYHQMGGYVKRCRGINLYCKFENVFGSRIQQLFAEAQPLQLDRSYRVAFVTEQAVAQRYGDNRQDLDIQAVEALRQYIVKHSPVSAELRGSIVAV